MDPSYKLRTFFLKTSARLNKIEYNDLLYEKYSKKQENQSKSKTESQNKKNIEKKTKLINEIEQDLVYLEHYLQKLVLNKKINLTTQEKLNNQILFLNNEIEKIKRNS